MDLMDFYLLGKRQKLSNPCPHRAYNLVVDNQYTSNHNPSQKNTVTKRKVQSCVGISGDKGAIWLED